MPFTKGGYVSPHCPDQAAGPDMAFPAAAHRPAALPKARGKAETATPLALGTLCRRAPSPSPAKGLTINPVKIQKSAATIPKSAQPSVIGSDTCRSVAVNPFFPHPNAQALVTVDGILPPFGRATGPKDSPCVSCSVRLLTDSRGACAHADGPPAAHRALRPRLPPLVKVLRTATTKSAQGDYRFSLVFSLVGDMHRLRFPPHFTSAILIEGSMLFTPSSQTSTRRRRIRNMLAPGGCGPAFVLWPSPHANA